MPRFLEMERKQRSVIYALWSAQRKRRRRPEAGSGARWSLFVTLAGGMGELVDAVSQRLSEGCVRLNAGVTHLRFYPERKSWSVRVGANETLEAGAIIVATPAYRTAEIIASAAPAAAMELQQISYASTATVSLAYKRADFPQPPDSFGFVVPATEKRKIMACTFSSLKYPGRAPQGNVLLRAFIGGSLQPELFNHDDAALERNVRDEIAGLLGVRAEPILSRIWRHPDSMPQYHVGHQERIRRIEAALLEFPTLALAGSAYRGVGISDCVRTGEEAAERVVQQAIGNRDSRQ
jgi:oxygen-dependent protoporphyrinogen oxidase